VDPEKIADRIDLAKCGVMNRKAFFTTSDRDILRRDWMFTDIDPVRAKEFEHSCATEAERREARRVTKAILDSLKSRGWPGCYVIDSGNGTQLRHRIDLPNDPEAKRIVKRCLRALHQLSTEGAKVDLT